MADKLLLEGGVDRFLLEDGSGVLLLDSLIAPVDPGPAPFSPVFVPVGAGLLPTPGTPVVGPYAAVPTGSMGGFAAQDGVIYGPSTKVGSGVLQPLAPAPLPIRKSNTGARTEEINSRLGESFALAAVGHTEASLHKMARAMGAIYFVGTVSAASDTRFPHNAGRIPSVIVMSIALDGSANRVIGGPSGTGANAEPWTSTDVYVRAQATGDYAFLVI